MSGGIASVVDLAIEHAYRTEPCGGGTRPDGSPDHWVDECKAGDQSGEPHAFDHAEHVRTLLQAEIDDAYRILAERMTPSQDEIDKGDVEGYRARVMAEAAWVFAEMGGSDFG